METRSSCPDGGTRATLHWSHFGSGLHLRHRHGSSHRHAKSRARGCRGRTSSGTSRVGTSRRQASLSVGSAESHVDRVVLGRVLMNTPSARSSSPRTCWTAPEEVLWEHSAVHMVRLAERDHARAGAAPFCHGARMRCGVGESFHLCGWPITSGKLERRVLERCAPPRSLRGTRRTGTLSPTPCRTRASSGHRGSARGPSGSASSSAPGRGQIVRKAAISVSDRASIARTSQVLGMVASSLVDGTPLFLSVRLLVDERLVARSSVQRRLQQREIAYCRQQFPISRPLLLAERRPVPHHVFITAPRTCRRLREDVLDLQLAEAGVGAQSESIQDIPGMRQRLALQGATNSFICWGPTHKVVIGYPDLRHFRHSCATR